MSGQDADPAKGSGEVLCIGNALLDVTFFVDGAFLEEHNLKPNDATTLDQDKFNQLHDELEKRFHASGHVPGGGSQNVARTVQWLLPEAAPGAVTYLGAICCDRIGNILQEKARHAGINGVYEIVDDPTGCCLVLVSGEHNERRSLAANLGGASKYSLEHLTENWQHAEKAKLVYVEGFFLASNSEAAVKLGKHVAGTPNKKLGLCLSAPYIATDHKQQLLDVLPYVDVLFGNAEEFEAFGKALGVSGDLKTVAQAVAKLPKSRADPKRIVVCTHSEQPVIVAVGDEAAVKSFEIPKLESDRFVDRNGSGDAFVGGFLAQLLRGKTLDECIRCAFTTSAISIQHLGCTFPKDKPADIDKLTSKDQ